MRVHLAVLAACAVLTAFGELAAQGGSAGAIAWADLGPLQQRLEAGGLTADAFPAYLQRLRERHAVRVRDGDLDHLVFYLLQSTHFTSLPPLEPAVSARALVDSLSTAERTSYLGGSALDPARVPAAVRSRIAALLKALDVPAADARLRYFGELTRATFPDKAQRATEIGREYMRAMRFVYQKEFVAQRSATPADAVADLYRSRGLSTDTAVEAGFLVATGLGLLKALEPDRRIRRVLIVGPGLDLAPRTALLEDGQPESYQPWAVMDALVAAGLSRMADLSVVGADINPRVVSHLRRSHDGPPTLNLVSEIREDATVSMSPEYKEYFDTLGRAIAGPGKAAPAQATVDGRLRKRVRVSGAAANALSAVPLDIVTERLRGQTFDLVIATNILPYFDDQELALATSNIASMLAPGGVLLHNEARPALDGISRAVGLPFEHARHAVVARVRGAPAPLFDSVWLHRKADGPPRVVRDLTPLHDATRALVNPHKGWYHHYPDNHINKYEIARDADLLAFPGMDHLYIRLAWAYLEPKEGQYDWALIDRMIEKWTAHGLGIAFRISCKETSTDRIEQQFATPRWVMEAGARGGHYRMGEPVGPEGPWEPNYDDPVFLEKLERFLAAFAARYDGQPWLRYVDVGSIGDWGEGHLWAGSRTTLSFAVRKRHVDLHLKYFTRSRLVISDDYVHAVPDPAERATLHDYIVANGISYRDDSIMVNGNFSGSGDRFTVRSPEFFAGAFRLTPTVLELEHYGKVKSLGNWEPKPGSASFEFGKGKTGPDFFRGAIDLLHATYIGYHGYAREWLTDNPELTRELLNRCGYWLFPTSIELPPTLVAGSRVPLKVTMENRGVAPPYAPYELRIKLSSAGTNVVSTVATAGTSWLPGVPVVVRHELALPSDLKAGSYDVALGLFDVSQGKTRAVEFALKASARDAEGYYQLMKVPVTAARPSDR